MTMIEAFVTVTFFLTLFNTFVLLAVFTERARRRAEAALEDQVQDAMDAEAGDADGNGKDRRGSFDEGFDNIMRYSVNGKTGFEENG